MKSMETSSVLHDVSSPKNHHPPWRRWYHVWDSTPGEATNGILIRGSKDSKEKMKGWHETLDTCWKEVVGSYAPYTPGWGPCVGHTRQYVITHPLNGFKHMWVSYFLRAIHPYIPVKFIFHGIFEARFPTKILPLRSED